MVVHRSELLAIGGFDEAFARAAEDGDLCFRWLRSGRTLRYEPAMTVWHRDWRSRDELRALNVRYAFDQGRMYGKHLWRRDWAITPFVARDAREAVRADAHPAAPGPAGGGQPTGAAGSPAACPRASSSAWRNRRGSSMRQVRSP